MILIVPFNKLKWSTFSRQFQMHFFNENVGILIKISLKLVLNGPINNIPALVLIMAWCRPGDKPLSVTLMVGLSTFLCVTRSQWVHISSPIGFRSRFSQCVDYMRFNEKSFCFRWQETTKLMLFFNTKTSSLVVLCDLRYLTGNISSVMTKHMGVQRKLHRFAYLIGQIILWFYS